MGGSADDHPSAGTRPMEDQAAFNVDTHFHVILMPYADEQGTIYIESTDQGENVYYVRVLEEVRRCYRLPETSKFNLYLDSERRLLLSTSNIQQYISPTRTTPLHIYVLPADFIVLSVFVTVENGFPSQSNPFAAHARVLEEGLFRMAYHPKSNPNLITEFRARLNQFLISQHPNLVAMRDDLRDMTIAVYTNNGSRHIQSNTLKHGEFIILKITTANLLLQERIQSIYRTAMAAKATQYPALLVPQQEVTVFPRNMPPQSALPRSSTSSASANSSSAQREAIPHREAPLPAAPLPAATDGLTAEQRELKARIESLSYIVANSSIKKMWTRSSSQEGRLNYFLENSALFDNDVDEVEEAAVPVALTPPPPPRNEVDFASLEQSQLSEQLTSLGVHISPKNIIALSKRSNTVDGMVNYYFNNAPQFDGADIEDILLPPPPLMAVKKKCMICREDFEMSDMYLLNCENNHPFCIDCMYGHVNHSVHPSADSAGYIPSCPLANGETGCKHVLEQREVEQILNLQKEANAEDRKKTLALAKRLYFVRACQADGGVCCPNCPTEVDGGSWVQLADNQLQSAKGVACPRCKLTFCSQCKQSPYHYGCKCDEVLTYSRQWLDWRSSGQHRFEQELSARDAAYQQQVESRRREHQAEVAAAQARFRELKATEETLAQTFKMCPHCRAAISKIDGCDSMVCGRDYHGNQIGAGCGRNFNWSSAPRYEPRIAAEDNRADRIALVVPEQAAQVVHEIMPGLPLQCDVCKEGVKGPLIKCLNCPAFNMCFRCSSTVDFGANVDENHNNLHICHVILE